MRDALVVAPARFGSEAEEFVARACAELSSCRGTIVTDRSDLETVLESLTPRSLVLGSLSSDLAIEVAALAEERDLVHLEVGALNDRAVGRNSLRLSGRAAETASLAASTLAGRTYRIVAESSPFALSLIDALSKASLTGLEVVPMAQAIDDFAAYWRAGDPSDVLIAIARPPYPEELCDAIGRSGLPGIKILGLGSWARRIVDRAATAAAVMLRFIDVFPANLLNLDALADPLRASLLSYLPGRRSVYGDLGWAAGQFAHAALEDSAEDAYCVLRQIRFDASQVGFGHGIAFDDDGHNRLAEKALLLWQRGELVLARADDVGDS